MKLPVQLGFLFLVLSSVAQGQSFDVTAGGNQTYNAYGVQTEFKYKSVSGWTGLGYSDGFRIGAYIQAQVRKDYHVGIGDQLLPGYLDIDQYDTRAFTVRGANLVGKTATSGIQVFAGLLTQEQAYPFFHMSETSGGSLTETPMGAVLFWKRFSSTLQMHSMFLVQSKVTSIQSIGWNPSKKWGLAAAGGIGSGAGYLAGKGDFKLDKANGWASYTVSGKEFHREDSPFFSSEPYGLNAQLKVAPWSLLQFDFDHENTRVFIPSFPLVESHYDNASASANVKRFQLGASYGVSSTNNLSGHTTSESFSAQRQILPRWRAFGAYVKMDSPNFKQNTFVATNEFRVSPRLAIRQNYNRINGQDNISMGGTWLSNLFSLSVDQQTYVSPIASAFGGKSVFAAWTVSIRFRTPHGTVAHVNTFISPQGKVEWGGYMGGLRYNAIAPTVNSGPVFSKYIIQGKVEDEGGNGVWGIAVNIGTDTVLSDNDGVFYTHVKNAKPVPFAVAADASLQGQRWTLASAPTSAHGALAATAEPVRVVVQMTNHNREIAQAGCN